MEDTPGILPSLQIDNDQPVTLFEVSIVFVSISALAGSRNLLFIAGGTSAIGVIFLVIGFLHHL